MNGVTDQPVDPARAERIKQLNEDLKRVREHKAQLLAQQKVLQQLQAAGGSKLPPSKQKAGDKRPGEPHERESKRARIEADRRKRLDAMFSTCSNIIKNIKRSTDATPFMKPVDPIALGIPDYFNIVKQPMDLGTISQRLENKARQPRQYQSPLEFLADMRLVWNNCRLYNRPGDQVRVMGDKLSDQFERRWEQAGIERKFQEHVEKCTREDTEVEGQTPLKDKINAYDTSLKRHFENTPSQPGDSTKPMQFEQKRRLSVALGSLSGEHLAGVLQIVASSVPDNNSEEVELDMDSLDDGVLWKLEAYVNSKLTNKGKPAKAASGVSGAGPGVAAGAASGGAAAPAANGLPLGMKVDEDGMKAEGDAGASVQQEQDQAQGNAAAAPAAGAANGAPGPEPAAGAGEGAVKDDKASNSSSSSSSGSGSSSSTGSDSEEVVSKDNVGSTLGDPHGDAGKRQQSAAGGGEGLEASALVSATRPLPHQPQILKQTTSKKEIAIENAGAWAAMAAEAEGQDEEAGAEEANADGGQQPEGEDALWSEFMSREQQQQKRQEEELKEEERRRAEKEKEEEERARDEEKAKGEEEREKQAQLASKEREERERRDQLRAKEVAELQSMGETNQHADMGFTMDVAGVAAAEGQNGEDYDMD